MATLTDKYNCTELICSLTGRCNMSIKRYTHDGERVRVTMATDDGHTISMVVFKKDLFSEIEHAN